MFAKLTALVLALPLVSALTINTPIGATTGGMVTLTWTATTTDPTSFTFELTNTIFHNTFAIANTVTTSQGSITIQLPQVPVGDGYTLEAVANNNVNQVYAQSGDFAVGAQTSATTTSASTTSAATGSTASTASAVSTTTAPASSGTASSSSTSASVTPSSFSNGAVSPFKFGLGVGPAAAVVLSAVAGAVMVF